MATINTGPEHWPMPGDRKYSRFFGSFIELMHYTSDRDYLFKVIDNPKYPGVYKNKSNWSELPFEADP